MAGGYGAYACCNRSDFLSSFPFTDLTVWAAGAMTLLPLGTVGSGGFFHATRGIPRTLSLGCPCRWLRKGPQRRAPTPKGICDDQARFGEIQD